MKKTQLRQLVGDSYRDLIASADTISNMAHVCEQIVSNLDAIQVRKEATSRPVHPRPTTDELYRAVQQHRQHQQRQGCQG